MSCLRCSCLFVGGLMSCLRCLCLFVGGLMSCLRCLCLLTCGGFQRIIVLCFCFVFRRSVSPVLLVSLNCPFLITPSVFSNDYF